MSARLVIIETDVDWHTETDEQGRVWTDKPPPSYRPHYVRKVGSNGETIWTSESLYDRSGAVRFARREAAEHKVPLRIVRTWLGEEWVPAKGDPDPFDADRTCDAYASPSGLLCTAPARHSGGQGHVATDGKRVLEVWAAR